MTKSKPAIRKDGTRPRDPKFKPWAPENVKLSPETQASVVGYLRAGRSMEETLAAHNLTPRNFYDWREKDAKFAAATQPFVSKTRPRQPRDSRGKKVVGLRQRTELPTTIKLGSPVVTEFDECVAQMILDAVATGSSLPGACAAAGIPRSTAQKWFTGEEDFRTALEMAHELAIAHAERPLTEATDSNWQSSLAWLERRAPTDYGRQTKVVADVNVTHDFEAQRARARVYLERLSNEELDELVADPEKLKALPAAVDAVFKAVEQEAS